VQIHAFLNFFLKALYTLMQDNLLI